MKRTTTPTHIFTMNIDPSTITALNITYSQYNSLDRQEKEIILVKTLNDCTIGTDNVSITLTQEETNLFQGAEVIDIQLHAMVGDKSYQSNIIHTICHEVLNDEVLD